MARFGALAASIFAAAAASGAAAQAEPCFRAQGAGAACVSVAELAAEGVTAVRFVPKSLSMSGSHWRVLAYGPASQSLQVRELTAVVDGPAPSDLEDALARQDEICSVLTAAGVACARDHLAGEWKSYESGNGRAPFVARFTAVDTSAMASKGTLETRQWACVAGGESPTETEVVCHAAYETSLAELYATGKSRFVLRSARCEAGETRAPTGGAAAQRACDPAGAYPAAQWLPLAGPAQIFVYSNAARVHLPQANVSLYFQGL